MMLSFVKSLELEMLESKVFISKFGIPYLTLSQLYYLLAE